jgi:hypothetical protein
MGSTRANVKKLKYSNKEQMLRDRLVGKYNISLRRTKSIEAAIYTLKTKTEPEQLFSIFPVLPNLNSHLEKIYGDPFPKKISDLFSTPVLGIPSTKVSELMWALCRCIQFGNRLQGFTKMQVRYEESILRDDKEGCAKLLDGIEENFGVSTWLIQARLCTAQHWDGFEGARRVEEGYISEIESNHFLQLIFWFIKKRIDATAVKDNLEAELKSITAEYDEVLKKYLQCKILDQVEMPPDSVAPMLFHEAHSGIIDTYEATVCVLQALVTQNIMPNPVKAIFVKSISVLFDKTKDSRLLGVLRAFGIYRPEYAVLDTLRSQALESYISSDYQGFFPLAKKVLDVAPGDMYIFVLKVKASVACSMDFTESKGIESYLESNLRDIFSLTEKSYTAAHAILTLARRYYNHAWANYLKSFVMHELQSESYEFPAYWLRDVILRDQYLSPSSLLIAKQSLKSKILEEKEFIEVFPKNIRLYKIADSGKDTSNEEVAEYKLKKALARFQLSHKLHNDALETYKWLYDNSDFSEKIKFGGGLALAYLSKKDFSSAARIAVTSFLDRPEIPTAVPIREIVDALPGADLWPNCVCIPLILGLHLEFFDPSKLAELRYAFEKFQVENDIDTPEDLVLVLKSSQENIVIAYLDRIWRPEIMRKTVLYNGTKQIEEARIKVCQRLVDLDPVNSKKYFEEIKDRVKQQAIAKGMTLVEQSKVYVDIDAIKKVLKTKLGDTYARYKTITPTLPTASEVLLESLSHLILESRNAGDSTTARILADLRVLSRDTTSETDAQFDALFSEVTSEFLKGGHGLNAYLSTRVRHGTLSSTLRKAVEDEKLVTSKEEKRDNYLPNDYWVESFSNGIAPSVEAEIKEALNIFSKEFDGILDYLKDRLLQVIVVNDAGTIGDERHALFIYNSSRLERKAAQVEDRTVKDIDQFIERCVDSLWEKTDRNLESVQRVFSTTIRDRVSEVFDSLVSRISEMQGLLVHSELINAIGRARTNTRTRLDIVTSWFRRSEVYDRQDYAVDFPVHIAVNMIKNTMSVAANWAGVECSVTENSNLMPGRTLDGMAYVFYGLIENAINHSRLNVADVNIRVNLSYLNGQFVAEFSNKVNIDLIDDEDLAKVEQIRQSIKLKESSRRAQGEGSSGLHKIWLTASGPMHKEPSLDFDWLDENFVVGIKFLV